MLRLIFLVVFLRRIKRRREEDLSRDRAGEFAALLQSRRGRAGSGFLLGSGEETRRTILAAEVWSLAMPGGRIMNLPEDTEQRGEAELRGFIFHLHHFGMSGRARAHVFVSRVLRHAPRVADAGIRNTFHLRELRLDTPKTARAEQHFFARRLRSVLMEGERRGIDTIAKASRRRSILEDVAEVRVAAHAVNFCADHPEARVRGTTDILLSHGLKETGPASAGIELRIRMKQRQSAAHARVEAVLMVVVKDAAEGPLRVMCARDAELFVRELRPPGIVGLDDLRHLDR